MKVQNYANHRRFLKGYHLVLFFMLAIGLMVSVVNLLQSITKSNFTEALLLALLFVCLMIFFWYVRIFPLKAQDRAIRVEETLRYFLITGKPLSKELRISQIIALRFADDQELELLVEKTIKENLNSDEIKQCIKHWRSDFHRV
jgi:hypothetical protein